MRVCIDVQAAVGQRAGVGRYVQCLVRELAPLRDRDELVLVHFDFRNHASGWTVPDVEHRVVRSVPRRWVQAAWNVLGLPAFDRFSGPADLFHFPNFVRPPLAAGRSIVSIHDLSFLRHPETAEPKNLAYLRRHVAAGAARADAVIAVSEFVATELIDALGLPPSKVFVALEGVDDRFREASPAAVAELRRRLDLPAPYLLHVGTIEPRKNLAFLIEVFERLEDFDGDLVLAGMLGWRVEPILERIRRSPKRDRIRHLNFVPDADLPTLYSGAEAFVFPSLYEGFGLPPLEALGCGTPVITSAGGSLPEVVGDAADVVASYDTDEWAERIASVLRGNARAEKSDRVARAASFRWSETARRTWEIYRTVWDRR